MRALILLLLSLVLPVSSFSAHAASVKDDLSLIELPVKMPSDAPMVLFLSGDGGWAALDKGLSAQFQLHGMPVVGWSSLTYYWKRKPRSRRPPIWSGSSMIIKLAGSAPAGCWSVSRLVPRLSPSSSTGCRSTIVRGWSGP